MTADPYVCPRCGRAVDEQRPYCSSCGLDLASQYQLPTSAEWLARQRHKQPSWGDDRAELPSSAWTGQQTVGLSVPTATGSTITGRFRSLPGIMLGSGAFVFAGSALIWSIGALLLLIFALDNDAPAGNSVGYGFQLLSDVVLVGAFVVAGVAFLGRRSRRTGRLGIGAVLAGGGFFALLTYYGIIAALDATNGVSSTGVAAEAVLGGGALLLLVTVVLAASGFFSPTDRDCHQPLRDGRLGSASICLAIGLGLLMTGEILAAVTASSVSTLLGSYASGSGVIAAGWGCGIGAAVVAAVAFLKSQQRQEESWRPTRDLLLAIASVVFALTFLLVGIGGMLRASSVSNLGELVPSGTGFGQVEAYFWLTGAGELVLIAGAVCGAIGFFFAWRFRGDESAFVTEQPSMASPVALPVPERPGHKEDVPAVNDLAPDCPRCGSTNARGAVYCCRCGNHLGLRQEGQAEDADAAFRPTRDCSQCGYRNKPTAIYCRSCGNQLGLRGA